MKPPENTDPQSTGSTIVTMSGRVYTAAPDETVAVDEHDVKDLQCRGWRLDDLGA
jgi:hypothetical protein